jgi:hypothetical protein
MKKSTTPSHVEKEDKLEEALAVLISCTRNKSRPLSLTEIVKWLEIAVDRLGNIKAVAERIGLSEKMLRQFLHVRRLSPDVQVLFASRQLDSVDAAVHLSMLSEAEQKAAAIALLSGKINTIDLRAVINLRRSGDKKKIGFLLQRVVDSKVKREYVAEFVIRGNLGNQDIRQRLAKYIPASEIASLEVEGALGRLVLTQKGKNALTSTAKNMGTPLKRVLSKILYN